METWKQLHDFLGFSSTTFRSKTRIMDEKHIYTVFIKKEKRKILEKLKSVKSKMEPDSYKVLYKKCNSYDPDLRQAELHNMFPDANAWLDY